jgi:predicted ATPase
MTFQIPLSSISVTGYKAFKEKSTIKVNNFTLLFGYNNTGKSALIRLFPFLADSFKPKKFTSYTASYMDYSSPALRGAILDDIKNKEAKKMSLGLTWGDGIGIDFDLKQDGIDAETISEFCLSKNSKKTLYRPTIEDFSIFENMSNNEDVIHMSSFSKIDKLDIQKYILNFSESVHWISSTRVHSPREFEIGMGIRVGVKPNGEGIGETIWYLSENKSPSFIDISKWLETTCDRHFVFNSSTSSTTSTGRRKVKLETVTKPSKESISSIKVGILDSGEGIAQALPVVTLCAMAANGELGPSPIVTIEQPELHLHPKAVIILANFIVRCSQKNNDAKFVIETHSESFLLALQMAIIEKDLELDSFSCYWTDSKNNSSYLSEVKFDNEGFITGNWPQSVFREVINQSKDLIIKRQGMNT